MKKGDLKKKIFRKNCFDWNWFLAKIILSKQRFSFEAIQIARKSNI